MRLLVNLYVLKDVNRSALHNQSINLGVSLLTMPGSMINFNGRESLQLLVAVLIFERMSSTAHGKVL